MSPSLPDIIQRLSDLSGSELNTLLLQVFDNQVNKITPPQLLKLYQTNRFVHPSGSDMIGLLKLEATTLELLQTNGFQPIELSPAAQLGSCAVVATASQKKILSATRNTEITADATNALALHIADLKSSGKASNKATGNQRLPAGEIYHFCTVHRHIRTQELKGRGFTAHFKVGCLVSSGRDTGSYEFECTQLLQHLRTLDHLFRNAYAITNIRFKLQRRDGYDNRNPLLARLLDHIHRHAPDLNVSGEEPAVANNYYKGIQFKMIIPFHDNEIEIADGGFVDWTQQLLGNKKERLLISGFGLELLYKLQSGLL